MKRGRPVRRAMPSLLAALLALATLSGCATMRAGEPRGSPSWPGRERLKQATLHALRSPATWGTAAVAAVLASRDWDGKISEWAVDRSPVFGSPRSARDASDMLRTATHAAMIATALLAPRERVSFQAKLQRIAVEQAGIEITAVLTDEIKDATDRLRPDASDFGSFPSAHASRAFAYGAMALGNLEDYDLSPASSRGLRIGITALAAGTAWARVEGGKHYPSDVLAGAALGNFLGTWIHDAFLGTDPRAGLEVRVGRHEAAVGLRLALPPRRATAPRSREDP
jgi:hypothetical protein